MRYGIMCVLATTAMVAVAARPASAVDQGSTSTDVRLAVAGDQYLEEGGVPVQEVQYRPGYTRRGTYARPDARGYYRGSGYRYPYQSFDGRRYYRSPYYYGPRYQNRYPRGYTRDGFYLRTPGFRFGVGW
jgi:hypothetical protein